MARWKRHFSQAELALRRQLHDTHRIHIRMIAPKSGTNLDEYCYIMWCMTCNDGIAESFTVYTACIPTLHEGSHG